MLMTRYIRSAFVGSAGVVIAGAVMPAGITFGGPSTAAEAQGLAPSTTAEVPQLVYSPWAKFCGKGNDPAAKEVCFTGTDARTEACQPIFSVALIEPQGAPKKLFRVMLPTSAFRSDTVVRLLINDEPAIRSISSFFCRPNGCFADFEATPELVDNLKKGRMLQIQVTNVAAAALTFPLPLVDTIGNSFAGANEGPPTDPRVLAEREKKKCKP
jgi:invasion protein IalB